MTELTKTEIALLLAAAERPEGAVILPERLKPASRQRLAGKLTRLGLVCAGPEGGAELTLMTAGYRAVGLRPPRPARQPGPAESGPAETTPGTKQALILGLLARQDGASLAELIEATGWLPHTTRAALCRIRKVRALAKAARPDGRAAYRLEAAAQPAEAPTTAEVPPRSRRRKAEVAEVQAAA